MMKIQDLIFFFAFLLILWLRKPRLAAIIGFFCLFMAAFLFKFWIFFTAERLTWYAAAFFFYTAVCLFLKELKTKKAFK